MSSAPQGPGTTLIESLALRAAERAEATALRDESGDVAYGTLYQRAQSVAAALADAGIGPGDRVVHLALDSVVLYELLYGAALTGAVVVPISVRLSDTEVAHVVEHSGARLAIADDPRRIPEPVHPLALVDFAAWRDRDLPTPQMYAAGVNTPVVQLYTSGTTGLPKGVVLAHRTFSAVRSLLDAAGLDWIDWRDSDVNLLALTGAHIGGLWWAVQGLNAGVPNVIVPAFNPTHVRRTIAEQSVTSTCLVPAMVRMLLDEPGARDDFAAVRRIVYGGSPIGRDLLERAFAEIGSDFVQIYGLTETGNTAVCLSAAEHRRPNAPLHAAGRPYPGVDLQIRSDDGQVLGANSPGEVFLRSPAQMIGYFDNPEATAHTVTQGWIATGDIGYLDTDGLLVIHDRAKDLIVVGGENVYSADVEKVIGAHLHVHDCAVIGVPDDHWGERIHAFVVPEPGTELTPGAIARSLRGQLAGYKAPASYEFVDEIPRTASGKPLRRILRDRFWADRDRQVN